MTRKISSKQMTADPEAALQAQFTRWRQIDRWIDRLLLGALLGMLLMTGIVLQGMMHSTPRSISVSDPESFASLQAINGDLVALLSIEDTSIRYPVVQGRDNFEYLSKAFTGEFSAAGTLFLDAENKGDFSDAYNIIYGHHMDGGAMFGSLDRYLESAYLQTHRRGTLQTESRDYDLEVVCAGVYDAYDGRVFTPGLRPGEAVLKWDEPPPAQLLALSTCTDEMNDNRTVVFFEMTNERNHE